MLRQHLEQRHGVLLAVGVIVIEALYRSDAQVSGQVSKVLIQARRGGQGGLAAKHGCDPAKSATEPATQSRLIAGGAPAQKGPCQIIARISRALVRQGAGERGGGERPIPVVNDLTV